MPANCSVPDCKYTTTRMCAGMCFNHYQKVYEETHPDYVARKRITSRAWARKKYATISAYHRQPIYRYKNLIHCARRRELSCTVTFEQWCQLVIDKKCTYCEGFLPPIGSALDRKNSQLGYETENVVACCTACNEIKGEDNISHEEMLYLIPLLMAYRSSRLAKSASISV